MKKMKNLGFLLLFLCTSVFSYGQEIIKIKVKENTVPCTGVAPMECLQVKEGKSKEWSNFYSSIEGFNYEPGYTYKLKVIKTKREGAVPADASAYEYQLKKVVCKKKVKSNKSKEAVNYLNQKMILTELNGNKIDSGNVYMTMDSSNNSIYGKSACNRFGASYAIKGETITFTPGMGTLMGCNDEAMKLEHEFLTALKGDYTVKQSGNIISFFDTKTKSKVLEFTIPTQNDVWSFIDGKEFKLFMLDNTGMDYGKASIRFDVETNKVSGNSGCNNFFGTYEATKDHIKFSSLASTKMACLDENKSNTETKVLQYLSDNNLKYDVAEQTINFYLNDRLVMMFGLQY